MKILFRLVGVIVAVLVLLGAESPTPAVPDNLKAPAGEEVVLDGHATGFQIYVCQAQSDQKSAWVLKAPEADLTDAAGKKIIHHFAGPTWKHIDGSEVTGKLVAKHDAPQPGAIPWLLLSAASHTGDGILSKVTTIQRIHTEGGLAPQGSECTTSANGQESKSAYSADYYFYAPAKK
jgi:hypothetical protein